MTSTELGHAAEEPTEPNSNKTHDEEHDGHPETVGRMARMNNQRNAGEQQHRNGTRPYFVAVARLYRVAPPDVKQQRN